MFNSNIIFTTLIVIFLCSSYISCQNKTLFVFEHFRHGARSPWINVNPETGYDLFNEKWDGEGELTPSGLRMHYLLGYRNHKKYENFISSSPNTNELLVYSTAVNRTIMSVYAHLQGMFPNQTGEILTETQIERANTLHYNYSQSLINEISSLGVSSLKNNISLFPVHIFDKNDRDILLNEYDVCPGILKYQNKNIQSKEGKNYLKEIASYINSTYGKQLFEYFNLTDPNYYYDRGNIYVLADSFISDYFDKRSLSNFEQTGINKDQFYIDSEKVADSDLFNLEFRTENDVLIYVGMSPTFRKIINWMERRIELDKKGTPDKIEKISPKMVIYSGHDTTVGLMSLFVEKVFNYKLVSPTFAANQYFELYKNEMNVYYVRYIFNDDEVFSLLYDVFKNKIEEVIWSKDKINKFCDGHLNDWELWKILTFVMIGVVFILIVILLYLKKYIN